MSENFAETHRNILFSNNVTATMRQMPGVLFATAGTSANYSGNKMARIENRFGRIVMSERIVRNGDTNNTDVDSVARFIKPGRLADVAPLLDEEDAENTSVDLGSALVNEVAQAAATYHDDMWSRGFWGNAYSGEDGSTAIPFKSSNTIVHGSAGVTLAKLIALRQLMVQRHVNFQREKPIVVLHPKGVSDLLNITEYKNFDYSASKPLENAELKPWMGFRFFEYVPDSESLPTSYANWFADANATYQSPVIVPSKVHRGIWREFKGSVDNRADKSHSTQFWGSARSAVVRTDEDGAFNLQYQ